MFSETAKSCIFTMKAAKQECPKDYQVPSADTRLLRARLILEEALETLDALGVRVRARSLGGQATIRDLSDLEFDVERTGNAVDVNVIDGCCDLIYVSVGTLLAYGAPDLPHLDEVIRCNNAKFPGGKAILSPEGKYLKPEGWRGPDHLRVAYDVRLQLEKEGING